MTSPRLISSLQILFYILFDLGGFAALQVTGIGNRLGNRRFLIGSIWHRTGTCEGLLQVQYWAFDLRIRRAIL